MNIIYRRSSFYAEMNANLKKKTCMYIPKKNPYPTITAHYPHEFIVNV